MPKKRKATDRLEVVANNTIPDSAWRVEQSGVIPYRVKGETLSVLLITSKRRKNWMIPKGRIMKHRSPVEAAHLEAFKGAGVKGHIYPSKIGDYEFSKWGGTCSVQVYLMEVQRILDEWPESSFRQRKWLTPAEAEQLVQLDSLRRMIQTLPGRLQQIIRYN